MFIKFMNFLFANENVDIRTNLINHLNILGKFDEKTLLTKNDNLTIGFKIRGIDYVGMSLEKEREIYTQRYNLFTSLKDSLDFNCFVKKLKAKREKSFLNLKNHFARDILERWENEIEVVEINYYLFVTTKKINILGQVDKNLKKRDTDDVDDFKFKKDKLDSFSIDIKSIFSDYSISELSSDEILSFYASLINAEEMKVDCDQYFFDDYFIKADFDFKKNYFERELPDKKIYSSILSISTYNSEQISRKEIVEFLKIDSNLYIHFGFSPLSKREAGKEILNAMTRTKNQSTIEELEILKNNYEIDKANLFSFTINILVQEKDLQSLNKAIEALVVVAKRHNLILKRESIAQDVSFLSFFPSNLSLSTRIRTQTSAVLTSYLSFENDPLGDDFNSWGDGAVALFKNNLGKPYLFNFHLPSTTGKRETDLKVGHTLIIGSTGSGKTSLASFLMTGLLKYDNLNIFALDKFRGMKIFSNFLDIDYNDVGENFKVNPFSLSGSEINRKFLEDWLALLVGLDKNDNDLENIERFEILRSAIDRINNYSFEEKKSLGRFLQSLENDELLKTKLSLYKDSILDNEEDSLDFKKRMSILNMDFVLKDPEMTSILGYYIFHKIISISREQERGFFIFVDELREYLGNPSVAHQILTLILEARKLNGVIAMGVQNIDFFDEMVGEKMANAFLNNIAHFIIYPTSNSDTLNTLQKKLELTSEEVEFLSSTPITSRKVLIKQGMPNHKGIKQSIIADVNLAPLRDYLKIYSSSIEDIRLMENFQLENPNNWREKFLIN